MHILLVPSYYPSIEHPVTGIFYHEQAKALVRAGHQIGVLVVPRINVTRDQIRREGIKSLRATTRETNFTEFPVYRMHWGYFPRPFAPFVAWFTARTAERAFKLYMDAHGKPDVIHAHNIFYGGVAAAHIGRKFNIPVVLTEHSTSYMEGLIIFPGQPAIIRRTLDAMAARIAVSSALREDMLRYQPTAQIEVIGNVINTDFFELLPAPPADQPFTFTVIGTLEKRKGHLALLNAFASAFRGKPVRLLIGGDGGTRPEIEAAITELGVGDQVTLLGWLSREQVRETLKQTHVLVSASLIESFGVTLIEALSTGRPVVTTQSGGPADFITPETGLLVPVGDVNAMTAALHQIHDHFAQYEPARIREYCVQRYSEQAIVNQLDAVYQRVTMTR